MNYQVVGAQAIPDYDASGIGLGTPPKQASIRSVSMGQVLRRLDALLAETATTVAMQFSSTTCSPTQFFSRKTLCRQELSMKISALSAAISSTKSSLSTLSKRQLRIAQLVHKLATPRVCQFTNGPNKLTKSSNFDSKATCELPLKLFFFKREGDFSPIGAEESCPILFFPILLLYRQLLSFPFSACSVAPCFSPILRRRGNGGRGKESWERE